MRYVNFCTVFFVSLLIGQNTTYKFDYYDISNGLSQNQAYVIYQTSDGYIYVGSQGGLDRFDGYNFKYYSHDPSDSTTIPYGWVNSIGEDADGNMWVGTWQGTVGYLNTKKEWKRVSLKGMENLERWWWGIITDIKFINDKVVLSSFNNGLFVIENGTQRHYKADENFLNFTQEMFITNERIFIATRSGLVEFDEKDGTFKKNL